MTGSVFRKTQSDQELSGEVRVRALRADWRPCCRAALLRRAQFFTAGTPSADYREVHRRGGRGAEEFYHERWRHAWLVPGYAVRR